MCWAFCGSQDAWMPIRPVLFSAEAEAAAAVDPVVVVETRVYRRLCIPLPGPPLLKLLPPPSRYVSTVMTTDPCGSRRDRRGRLCPARWRLPGAGCQCPGDQVLQVGVLGLRKRPSRVAGSPGSGSRTCLVAACHDPQLMEAFDVSQKPRKPGVLLLQVKTQSKQATGSRAYPACCCSTHLNVPPATSISKDSMRWV